MLRVARLSGSLLTLPFRPHQSTAVGFAGLCAFLPSVGVTKGEKEMILEHSTKRNERESQDLDQRLYSVQDNRE